MGFFSPPKPPAPAPLPQDNTEATEAKRREELARQKRRGRASTLLTSGQGVQGQGPVARKQLLGQ